MGRNIGRTWETLFADELAEFPGEKPKWKRVSNYLKHKLPAAGETPKNAQVEANDSTVSPKSKCKNCLAVRPQNLGGKTSEAKISVPKRTACVDTSSTKESSGEQVPKPATRLPPTSPTSSPSERERERVKQTTEAHRKL